MDQPYLLIYYTMPRSGHGGAHFRGAGGRPAGCLRQYRAGYHLYLLLAARVGWGEERTPTYRRRGVRWGSFVTPTYELDPAESTCHAVGA